MEYKRLEVVSVDGSIYSQDVAHEINCLACSNGFNYAKDEDELLTYQRFFESEITNVDESDVVQ